MVSCLTFMSLSPFETGFVLVLGWVLTSFVGMQLSSFVNDTFAISEKPREGPPLWAGKSPKNSQKHSMTVRFKCLPRVCFFLIFFFFFDLYSPAFHQPEKCQLEIHSDVSRE